MLNWFEEFDEDTYFKLFKDIVFSKYNPLCNDPPYF